MPFYQILVFVRSDSLLHPSQRPNGPTCYTPVQPVIHSQCTLQARPREVLHLKSLSNQTHISASRDDPQQPLPHIHQSRASTKNISSKCTLYITFLALHTTRTQQYTQKKQPKNVPQPLKIPKTSPSYPFIPFNVNHRLQNIQKQSLDLLKLTFNFDFPQSVWPTFELYFFFLLRRGPYLQIEAFSFQFYFSSL